MSATPVDPALTDAREGPGAVRRAYRDTQEPIIGGVARGLATHLGVPVVWVRAAFVLFTAIGGMGIALYAGLWMVLPSDSRFFEDAPGLESATRTGKRPGRVRRLTDVGPAIALGALAFGVVIAAEAVLGAGGLFWPLFIGMAGIALLWRQADEAQRERWIDTTGRINPVRAVFGSGGWASYARVGAGLLLILVALAGVLAAQRLGGLGARGRDRGTARHRRPGDRGRAVDLPPGLGPDRRARRAGPHPGAGRPGRPPARLGAADARPDPEELR